MADYRLGGDVDFGWLGNLGNVAREATERQTRKATLADLKSGDADSLLAAGAKLTAAGDLEGGLKLIAEGRQRKAIEQRGEELRFFMSQPRTDFSKITAPTEAGPASFPPAAPDVPAAPDLFQGAPGAIPGMGPRSALPAPAGPQQAAGPSPSEALILAAQQGGAPAGPLGPALAGPPPTPNTGPVGTPVMSAETLNAAAAPAVPAAPGAAVGGIPRGGEPPSARGQVPVQETPADVSRRIGAIAQEMSKPSSKYRAGELKALGDMMKIEINRHPAWDKDTKAFMTDQADRRAAGEPVQSRNQWDAENQTRGDTYKSAIKKYEGYSEEGQKGQSLNTVLGAMEGIVNHPQFAAGVGSPIFAQGVSALAALRDTAKVLGVPESTLSKFGDLSKITTPAALQEAFTALSNQAIYAKLGSLGNQISEGDRNFIKLAFPSLSLTKEGNLFLIGVMKKMAANAEVSGQAAQAYFEKAGPRANPAVMDRVVREAAKDNSLFVKDGQTTDVGEAVKAAVKAAREGTLQAPQQAPQQAAPAAAPAAAAPTGAPRKLNGPKTPENPSGRYLQLPGGQIVPENQT